MLSQSVRSPLCDFRVRENHRHSRGLGWRARVSGRQILEFQVWTGGFTAPVSARHFPISVSTCHRPVRYGTETGLRSRVSRVTGDVGMKSAASKHFYCRSPMLCSCSAHEHGSALARPVTVRSAGAVPSTIAAMIRLGKSLDLLVSRYSGWVDL